MKTLKISVIATIITAFIIAFCGVVTATADTMYPMTAKVITVDYITDVVTVENFTGFTFTFSGCEDWQVGDCCSLIMGDNDTELIYDDYIVQSRYGGWELINWRE